MSKVSAPPESLDEHLRQDGPQGPDYVAWKDAKIRRALAAAEKHPEKRTTQQAMWKKFGLER